jgi:hypothetical protein
MAKIAIYHMTRASFIGAGGSRGYIKDDHELVKSVMTAIVNEEYVYCARVKTQSPVSDGQGGYTAPDPISDMAHLEKAWHDTNSIEASWTENETVIFSAGRNQRSSMVGDLFWYDGKVYIVASMGFKMVGRTEEESQAVARVVAEGCQPGVAM